jgi:hypothetical protein
MIAASRNPDALPDYISEEDRKRLEEELEE